MALHTAGLVPIPIGGALYHLKHGDDEDNLQQFHVTDLDRTMIAHLRVEPDQRNTVAFIADAYGNPIGMLTNGDVFMCHNHRYEERQRIGRVEISATSSDVLAAFGQSVDDDTALIHVSLKPSDGTSDIVMRRKIAFAAASLVLYRIPGAQRMLNCYRLGEGMPRVVSRLLLGMNPDGTYRLWIVDHRGMIIGWITPKNGTERTDVFDADGTNVGTTTLRNLKTVPDPNSSTTADLATVTHVGAELRATVDDLSLSVLAQTRRNPVLQDRFGAGLLCLTLLHLMKQQEMELEQ